MNKSFSFELAEHGAVPLVVLSLRSYVSCTRPLAAYCCCSCTIFFSVVLYYISITLFLLSFFATFFSFWMKMDVDCNWRQNCWKMTQLREVHFFDDESDLIIILDPFIINKFCLLWFYWYSLHFESVSVAFFLFCNMIEYLRHSYRSKYFIFRDNIVDISKLMIFNACHWPSCFYRNYYVLRSTYIRGYFFHIFIQNCTSNFPEAPKIKIKFTLIDCFLKSIIRYFTIMYLFISFYISFIS